MRCSSCCNLIRSSFKPLISSARLAANALASASSASSSIICAWVCAFVVEVSFVALLVLNTAAAARAVLLEPEEFRAAEDVSLGVGGGVQGMMGTQPELPSAEGCVISLATFLCEVFSCSCKSASSWESWSDFSFHESRSVLKLLILSKVACSLVICSLLTTAGAFVPVSMYVFEICCKCVS